MTLAEIYTANNRDGQTWLVADNPYELVSQPEEYWQFSRDNPKILLTDHLPDGTKVRGDEITEPKWEYCIKDEMGCFVWINYQSATHKIILTRQVATLKKMRFEAVGVDDETSRICDWLLEKYNHDFTAEKGKFYHISRLSIAGIIIEYHKIREKSREK